MSYSPTFIAFVFLLLLNACRPVDSTGQTLRNYDLKVPLKFVMPESLHEISGIAFYKMNNDTVYAIQDEDGKLFRLAWNKKKQYHSKFGNKGDYEDLTIVKETVIILKSNGNLYSIPFNETTYEVPERVRELKHLLPAGEYEGLYGNDATGKLFILCKNCPKDVGREMVSGYILQAGEVISQAGNFKINVREIESFSGKLTRGFHPSAIAKCSVSEDWYILSAVNKLLVVTDDQWKVKEVCTLNPKIFNQPEGITFDKLGNLYISNEGDDFVEGNILKFYRR